MRLVLTLTCWILTVLPVSAQASRPLSLREAVRLAVEGGDVRVRLAQEQTRLEESRAAQARSALLPHLDGNLSARRQTVNLEALGLRPSGLFQPPTLVGPFGTVDARAEIRQSLFDLGDFRRYRAARTGVEASQLEVEDQAEQAAQSAAETYLEALRARASWRTAQASVELARELLALAQDRKNAGTGTGIEVTRAQVHLSREEQNLLLAEYTWRNALLRLKRLVGIDLGVPLELTDELGRTIRRLSMEEALDVARSHRPDLQAQRLRVEAARTAWEAARADRFPSLAGVANYGSIGSAVGDAIPTWTAGLALELPIFDGGLTDARRGEMAAAWRAEQIRLEDLERQVELEIRLALSAVTLAEGEVEVADRTVEQVTQELEQARRRYGAGVTTSLEITDAQTRLHEAEEARVLALYRFNLARVQLAAAVGSLRKELLP